MNHLIVSYQATDRRRASFLIELSQKKHQNPAHMITLTKEAAQHINKIKKEVPDDAQFLRIYVQSGGCSGYEYGMGFDRPREDDIQYESEGVKILIEPGSDVKMSGSKIHFDDGLHGKGFEINNPKAHSTCGCGKSFS